MASLQVVVAVLATGCAGPRSSQPAIGDETDVWFMQHMAGHLLQTTSILGLTDERITRPKLRGGSLPEVRRLAQQLLAEHRAQISKMTAWKRAWSTPKAKPPDGQRRRRSATGRLAGTLRG